MNCVEERDGRLRGKGKSRRESFGKREKEKLKVDKKERENGKEHKKKLSWKDFSFFLFLLTF